jgi:hypothetical protein
VEGGVLILQYADDTIIFMQHDSEKALNMKIILCILWKDMGIKINFHRSEVFYFGNVKEVQEQYRFF